MWGMFKPHHKAGGIAVATVAADKVADKAGEHVFLAIHDAISHHGLLWVSLSACTLGVIVPAVWVKWCNRGKGE